MKKCHLLAVYTALFTILSVSRAHSGDIGTVAEIELPIPPPSVTIDSGEKNPLPIEFKTEKKKRYEVDGIALEDPMDEVITKWSFDVSDIQDKGCRKKGPETRHLALRIGKEKYRQLMDDWAKLCPRSYAINKRGTSAYFNSKKLLIGFRFSKTYKGNFDPKDIIGKLIKKYGSPTDHNGRPIEVDNIKEIHGGIPDQIVFQINFYRTPRAGFTVDYTYVPYEAKLVFQAYDRDLDHKEPLQADAELIEQLRKKYIPTESKSDASEVRF
jgi:hypothetical protein